MTFFYLNSNSCQLFLEGAGTFHHLLPTLGQPLVEQVGVPGKLLPQLVVLLLPHLLLNMKNTFNNWF